MKLIHLLDVSKTITHDTLNRQQFIRPGDLKSPIQTVNYAEIQPGTSYTSHSHSDCEECFFVIEGQADATVVDKNIRLMKGDFLAIQAGEEHMFANNSESTFKYLQFRVLLS